MSNLVRDCEALIAAYGEIDRLRAGVVGLKAQIRSLEAKEIMALGYGTVPQNSTQVIDSIRSVHDGDVSHCHYDIGTAPKSRQTND